MHMRLWDVAAASLIAAEAGCRGGDLRTGRGLKLNATAHDRTIDLLAANPSMLRQVQAALRARPRK